MSKWINADSIINKLNSHVGFTTRPDVTRAIKIIKDEPGINVVRCKDCVHWQLLTSPFGLCVWNEDNKRQMKETGFCSCGVKR